MKRTSKKVNLSAFKLSHIKAFTILYSFLDKLDKKKDKKKKEKNKNKI